MQYVCRLCLGRISPLKVAFDIDEENGLIKNVNNIREMLLFCAPEIDIYISFPPVKICENCLPTLVSAYNFKVKCMNTENTIRAYVQKNKIREGSSINLTNVVGQIERLFQTGDATAGVVRHPEHRKETDINNRVLSMLRRPVANLQNTYIPSSNVPNKNVVVVTKKITPSITPKPGPRAATLKRKLSLPRQAKDKDQDIQVVTAATPELNIVSRPNAAPGTLRQDRRMAYLGLKRKSPERTHSDRTSMNNNDESPNKVIVLDDEPVFIGNEKTVPKIIISMNKDKSYVVNNNKSPPEAASKPPLPASPNSVCKPGEKVIKRFNEVTITKKVTSDEVLTLIYEEPEVCEIESSDEEVDVEIIEPRHPMIDLVDENVQKSPVKRTSTENNQKKEFPKPSPTKNTEQSSTNSSNFFERLLIQNPEYKDFFKKKLIVNLPRLTKKELQTKKFVVNLKKSRLYGCRYCSYGSLEKKTTDDHFKYKHTLKGFYFCKYCEFKSKNLSDLGEHARMLHMPEMVKYLQENSKDVLYSCSLCTYQGGNMLDLRHHRQKKHIKTTNSGILACPYQCPIQFEHASLKSMHKHIEQWHEREVHGSQFHCHICKFEIDSKALLARHLTAHKKSELLRCLMCPFSTKSQPKMDKHMKQHSEEDVETSSGMMYMEGHARKSTYNDDYRITLDSLRREAQQNYESVSSSSADMFGPSLSEMLLVGLTENFEYVDLTDGQEQPSIPSNNAPEIESVFLNDERDIEIIDDEEDQPPEKNESTLEVPSSTSDDSIKEKSTDKNSSSTSNESKGTSTSSNNDVEEATEIVDQNDEEHISTTTNCEEISDAPSPEDVVVDVTEESTTNTDESKKSNKENPDIDTTVDNSPTKLNTSFSNFSEESNVSSGTSDLTKNVIELEDSIRELNSVLGGHVPTKSLYGKEKDKSKLLEEDNDKTDDIIKEIDDICGNDDAADKNLTKNDDEITKETFENSTTSPDKQSEVSANKKTDTKSPTTSKLTVENSVKNGQEVTKNFAQKIMEDKLSALEKRCFLGADVKKISALEERFFKRDLNVSKSAEKID